jgi:hypothetical protein
VIVLAEEEPRALQMPAAALAAVSGAPILFTASSSVPAATARELRRLRHPSIYLPGGSPVTAAVRASLSRLGRVVRIAGAEAGEAGGHPPSVVESRDPIANAISVARFSDGSFGWGIHEAGHGLVFASAARPLDAPAAAALASHGDYGPLLLLNAHGSVPAALARYLSNIEPGYTASVSPVREVYNHGWLIGDQSAIPSLAQAELDAILEVAPRTPGSGETPVAPAE